MNRGSEGRDWRMSQWSCSWSMITVAQRTRSANLVAWSELVSCSSVNTGQRLLGLIIASSLFPPLG